ncbi:S8 family serine peptidase [Cohnella lupini]|uniref:Subtilase family protein n=1 Tax=Cohnella lupini TaxID=1294267 RepID=A0A3D9HTM8_9BACL|nr:S8 family serine peptidase [Cohnella lupini]RED52827.1 subtilase family protein [Cohnella lupini]
MKKDQLIKSFAVAAFMSLMIGAVSPAFVHATDVRKSKWTAENAPKEEVVQIASPAGKEDYEVKTTTPVISDIPYAGDRIIVKYKKGFTTTSTSILASSVKKNSVKLAGADATVVKLPASSDIEQVVEKLNNDPNVLYAEPDYKLYKAGLPEDQASLPDDTYFPLQWALHNTGQIPPYNYNNPELEGRPGPIGLDIKAPEAWKITKGSSDVVVAVIDTGIEINHPDLIDSIWVNPSERLNQNDDDKNGYADDLNGWNFIDENNIVYSEVDGDTHGTITAGIIAGSTDNGMGIAGIAPNVKIMPLKYIGPEYGLVSDLIEAIEYAEKNGAQIANISAEMYQSSEALKDAIESSKMLFVVAAGNQGVNTDMIPAYPASYDSPNILSVTSVDNEGNIPIDANIGYKSVDVAAPGEAIASTTTKSDVGLSAEIYDKAYDSKAIFNGIAFENILDDEDADQNYRQDAFNVAMDYLDASPYSDAKVLLVQDDLSNVSPIASSSKLSKYTQLLKGYGYVYEEEDDDGDGEIKKEYDIVQSSPNGGDGPSAAVMSEYDAVIWFTGSADRGTISNITVNDQQSLTEYLHGGGHLLLTGTNVLNGPTDSSGTQDSSIIDTPFVKDVLHLKFVDQYFYDTATGVPNTIYAGREYPLDEEKDSYNWIISRDSEIAKINLYNVTPDFKGSNYVYVRGTSYAAANASGVAALVLSQEPSLSSLAIKQRVVNSGTRLSSLAGRVASERMINAYKALTDDEIPGTPFLGGSVTNQLDMNTDPNDVYALDLHAGENVSISMTGDTNTDFDLFLYAPDTTTIAYSNENLLAYSENEQTSTESIEYKVATSGTYYLNAYAHKGAGEYAITVTTDNQIGGYEDNSSSLVFSGPWTSVNNNQYSGLTMKQINEKGKVEFAFVGTYFSWLGSKNQDQGIADVTIDGVKVASPSLYSSNSLNKQVIYEKSVPYGQHTVSIEWTGKRDPAGKKSGKAFINVDAFSVSELVEDSDPAALAIGPWQTSLSQKNYGGKAKYTSIKGSYILLPFEGTQVKLIATTGPNRGKANVYIDDELVSSDPIDMYSPTIGYRTVVFESTVISPGSHTIKVVNSGEKSSLSSGTYISVDAISIIK